jgi:hypothetical protein
MNDRQIVQRMHVDDLARESPACRQKVRRTSPIDTGTVLRSVMSSPRSASMIRPVPW